MPLVTMLCETCQVVGRYLLEGDRRCTQCGNPVVLHNQSLTGTKSFEQFTRSIVASAPQPIRDVALKPSVDAHVSSH